MSSRLLTKNRVRALIAVCIFITVSVTVARIPSDTLIDFVGAENAYVLMFTLGIIGGLTTMTGIPYHVILMSLAAGGINPILLGFTTAMGVMAGDSTMFFIGRRVRDALPEFANHFITHFKTHIERRPTLLAPGLFCYGMLCPFSNDIVVGSLSVMGYSYWRIVLPLTLGNIGFNIALAYIGIYAYDWFI